MMLPRTDMGARAYIHVRLLALAAAAGCIDAASFLGLDQVFTANQTGNTVLLGIALGEGDGHAIVRTAVSVAGFVAGVALGAAALRGIANGWSRRVAAVLAVEAVLLAAAGALWGPLGTVALIVVVAVAMGAQSAAAQQVGVPGITTTFVTGTLTRFAVQLVDRRGGSRPEAAPPLAWVAYLAGAVVGGTLSRWTTDGVTVLVGAAAVALSALPARAAAPRSRPTR
jgi:uncharacterized membrane protein YoaK (UPF0700 family)